MKAGISLLMLIAIAGCKFKNTTSSIKKDDLLTQQDSALLGGWTTCSSKTGSMMIMRNECIRWLFKANHCGFIGLGKPTIHFDWRLSGDTIYIKNKIGNLFIENGAYPLTEQRNQHNKTLIITDAAQQTEYYLEGLPK